MCMFKSAIILKDRVFIPDYDHHTQMLEELGIEDNMQNAETLFVRAELMPPNNDPFSDIDTWQFKVDQDIIPEWFVPEYEAGRMTAAVKEWAKDRIYIGVDNLNLTIGANYYLKDCKNVTLSENVNVRMCDSASITRMCDSASITRMCGSASITDMCGSASITDMCDSASITDMCDSASITRMCGSASITRMCGSASITDMCDSASITRMCDSASITRMCGSALLAISETWADNIKIESMILCDNATIKDNRTKTIYQSGDWKLVAVNQATP